MGVFVDFFVYPKDVSRFGLPKDGEVRSRNGREFRYLLLPPALIEELDKMELDPSEKVKDDVFLSALKNAVRNKYKKI